MEALIKAAQALVDALTTAVRSILDALRTIRDALDRAAANRRAVVARKENLTLYHNYGPQCWDVGQLPPYRRVPYRKE